MASQYPPKKNTAFTLYFTLRKADGTIIANPGTITKKVSIDGGAFADIAANVTEINTTYGLCSLVIAAGEMNGDAVSLYIIDDTADCVPITLTIHTTANTQDEIGADVAAVHVHVGTIDGHVTADYGSTEKAAIDLLDDADGGLGDVHTVVNGIHDTDIPAIQADSTEILTRLPDATAGATGGLSIVGSAMTLTTGTITSVATAVWDFLMTAMTTIGSVGKALAAWLTAPGTASTAFGTTDLVLCNNALMLLGNEALANLTDTTKKAVRLCVQFYSQAVDEALRAYTWNCATERVAVTADATAPAFGYGYRYALPADCLRVIGLEDKTYIYKIENGYLLTDEATCNLIYVKRITATEMDVLLRRTVSARLASLIAFPLTNSTSLAEAMFKLYKDCVQEAETVDAFEGTSEQLANNDWINSRG